MYRNGVVVDVLDALDYWVLIDGEVHAILCELGASCSELKKGDKVVVNEEPKKPVILYKVV